MSDDNNSVLDPSRLGEIKAIRDMVEEYSTPTIVQVVEPGTNVNALVAIAHDGVSAVRSSIFDEYREAPVRRTGTAGMLDLRSFIAHTNRFATPDTAIFANNDRQSPSVLSVLDYHPAGASSPAAFGKHRTSFHFPLSDEWKVWDKFDSTPMNMKDFAAFLEDNITDVMPKEMVELKDHALNFVTTLGGMERLADPATLMALSTNFSVHENSVVKQATTLQTGEAAIEFATEHTNSAGEKLKVPSMFVIAIPVFANDVRYQIIARLRYRIANGQPLFYYQLWRTDRVFDDAFDQAVVQIEEATKLPVLLGQPERA